MNFYQNETSKIYTYLDITICDIKFGYRNLRYQVLNYKEVIINSNKKEFRKCPQLTR